jgi:cytochrome P450
MPEPQDILHAARHADPYPYYARLRETPLFRDPQTQLWVATSPEVAEAALRHPQLCVRPPAEPVPRALLGTALGEVFAQLVRMTDGDFHARHKPDVERAASAWTRADVGAAGLAAAGDLRGRVDANRWLTAVPVQAMARLLGVDASERDATVAWVHQFTQGIAAGADAPTIAAADAAARDLMAQGAALGLDPVRAANRIAFMQQSLDATAGLIGNCVVAALRGDAREPLALVQHVAQHDPAVHNTRRFAAEALELAGHHLAAGDGVLVLLAPAQGFGAGPHRCPGEPIAMAIAAAALSIFRGADELRAFFGAHRGYRPLANARVPVFD